MMAQDPAPDAAKVRGLPNEPSPKFSYRVKFLPEMLLVIASRSRGHALGWLLAGREHQAVGPVWLFPAKRVEVTERATPAK